MSGIDEQLKKGEREVLEVLLNTSKELTDLEIANRLRWKLERVVSILQSLNQKELIFSSNKPYKYFKLTEEGERYVAINLPEIRLFEAIRNMNAEIKLEEAIELANLSGKERNIAISWAKKEGWIRTKKIDGITLVDTKVGNALSKIADILKLVKEEDSLSSHDRKIRASENRESLFKPAIIRGLVEVEKTESETSVRLIDPNRVEYLLEHSRDGIGNLEPSMIKSGEWRNRTFKPYNVDISPAYSNYGKKHPYAEFNDWLREIMVGLGFTEWFGPYVETEFWGHDTLFVPQDHVAREVQDQFRVIAPYDHGHIVDKKYYKAVKAVHENGGNTGSTGWDWPYSEEIATRLCLRPHTTPVSMRYLYEHREGPQKMFIIDRNFRSETLSATHAQEFDQCEGIIMDKKVTLRDLMGYLTSICKAVGIEKLKFKPGQFPFTEPSVETFGKHEKLGWIELGGSGLFRPEVTKPLGIKDQVLAWGLGSGRLYMASMGINDIRDLFSRDLNWLRRSYFVS